MTDFSQIKLISTDLEVAAILNQAQSTLKMWRYEGRGPKWFREGKSVRYKKEDVIRYIKSLGEPVDKEKYCGISKNI